MTTAMGCMTMERGSRATVGMTTVTGGIMIARGRMAQ